MISLGQLACLLAGTTTNKNKNFNFETDRGTIDAVWKVEADRYA
jgi:hypothetical protein